MFIVRVENLIFIDDYLLMIIYLMIGETLIDFRIIPEANCL